MTAPEQRPPIARISRRDFLRSAALGGAGLLGASLLACSSDDSDPTATSTADLSATPTVGGQATISAPTMTWTKLAPKGTGPDGTELPSPRFEHTLVTDGAKLYLFGGRDANEDLWTYDIAANQWNNKVVQGNGPPPPARVGHNAIWDSTRSKLVIFGGQDGTSFFSDSWEFDTATGSWNAPLAGVDQPPGALPPARAGAAACLDDSGHMLITHGQGPGGRLDDTWQFDLASSTWTDISPAAGEKRPTKRGLIDGAWDTRKRRLLTYGGQSDEAPFLDDLWGWSPEIADWGQIAREPRPSARNMYAMVYDISRTAALLVGGRSADGPVNDTWVFNSDGETWAEAAPSGEPITPRYGHDAAIAPNGTIYVFGGSDGTATFDDLWRLDIGS